VRDRQHIGVQHPPKPVPVRAVEQSLVAYPRVIDQNIDRPDLPVHLTQHPIHIGFVGQVDSQDHHRQVWMLGQQGVSQLFQELGPAGQQHQCRGSGGQLRCDLAPNAGGSTGDQGVAPIQGRHCNRAHNTPLPTKSH
jgi:hypothetical protein